MSLQQVASPGPKDTYLSIMNVRTTEELTEEHLQLERLSQHLKEKEEQRRHNLGVIGRTTENIIGHGMMYVWIGTMAVGDVVEQVYELLQ